MASNTWRVLCKYPAVRWYILTCVCKDAGDWLVRVANLLVVQEWAGTGTALSYLVLCSLIPKALLAPVGGLLSDRFDRRHLMVLLDALAGTIVLGFLVAVYYESVQILFAVTAMRSAISACYYPVTYGLLPLMVPNNQDMQYAGSIATSTYGLMSMLGGLVAGSTAAVIGHQACFAIDSATYFLSSLVMLTCVKGSFRGRPTTPDDSTIDATIDDITVGAESSAASKGRCGQCLETMFCGAGTTFNYLASCGCGMLIFMKATDSLIWGPGDIIGVEVATVRNADGSEDQDASAYRMGLYYCFCGLGVFLGPALANWFSSAERPVSLQRSCIVAIFITIIGWIMAANSTTFTFFLLSQWWSGIGYGILWAYSSLLLQLLIDRSMLGRVLSLEYFVYVIAETLTSSVTGPLYDSGFSTNDLCYFGAGIASLAFLFWVTYHSCGNGAARPEFNLEASNDDHSSHSFSDVIIVEAAGDKKKGKKSSSKDGDEPSAANHSNTTTSTGVTRRKLRGTNNSQGTDGEIPSNPHPGPIPQVVGFQHKKQAGAGKEAKKKDQSLIPSSQRPPVRPPPANTFMKEVETMV
eukprot:CAMPEP_0172445348 /NCGR_PEP_ID=MMETSP1065-20121228/5179_1 /TAXON_ID=265537 /ORGANISM="Amphiprora paludosa, Strain CCMP125" /LENGTH=579 /DNA_ID=CAMNT_0013196151 /DNA_START=44 /DNA_END=1783 /DNA_ORIENTATION=+